MINFIKSYNFAIRYVIGFGTKNIPENKYNLEIEEYIGLDRRSTPLRIYYSSKSTKKTIIIFLGASPDGEKHKAVNLLAKNLASLGYNVFIPRIPPLKQLNISNENIEWMTHIYKLIQSRDDVNADNIIGFGISYGGGMLLKASLEKEFQANPLKSIYLYGAGCNAKTILNFITNGEFSVNGYVKKIILKANTNLGTPCTILLAKAGSGTAASAADDNVGTSTMAANMSTANAPVVFNGTKRNHSFST